MSDEVRKQVSFFQSQLHLRRFTEQTLRILESILVSKDVKSLLQIRSHLKTLLRSESVGFFQEIAEKSVEHKLNVLEFFVRAFALVADVESCLALRYEALILRERKSVDENWLQVSYHEWFNFAKDSVENGFHYIAVKGCENALSCIQANNVVHAGAVEEIKRLKDVAVTLVSSHSVQAQTAEQLKKKEIQLDKMKSSVPTASRCMASSMFRDGIKKRNMRKLHELQRLQQNNNGG
ncbi:hypothetical protein IFM89_027443 [Coptis chinensis]|uniref:Uncharacterized protein n=1 Tax=Coptis chinensis TaxID=261450 RepID=A0A835LNV1_9MAGN|nr:hypothetical protein IFM89_027443 [Coptis chinensis]